MAVTALELITRAYYLSQIISRELEIPTGNQIADGLYLLNALIDFKNSDTHLIPYYVRDSFTAVIGQEKYSLENLLMIDTITFNIGPVRYAMQEMTREQYFGISRIDNIQSLPFCYRTERVFGGLDLYVYFLPDNTYEFNYSGKFGLTSVTLNQDISLVYDKFYIEYIRYELGNMICAEFGATFPDQSMLMLEQYRKKLQLVSPPDLSIQSQDYFSNGMGFDWQSANLYKGYWPF